MIKIPTVEEFFEQHIQRGVNNTHTNYLNVAKEFAKFHVKAATYRIITDSRHKLDKFNGTR